MYDLWQPWRVPNPQKPWEPPYRVSTGTTFTFRQHHECATWAEAVKFATKLRTTGQCHAKPEVKRVAGATAERHEWRVSWIPAHFVSYSVA